MGLLSGFRAGLLNTVPVDFYLRNGVETRPDGQEFFRWRKITLGCVYYTDSQQSEDDQMRLHFRERLTVSIPKGNSDVDFMGAIIALNGRVFVAEGNASMLMSENTPGAFDRTLIAYRDATASIPEVEEEDQQEDDDGE